MKILVTGSGGLIGGECVDHFAKQGHRVVGIDSNMRRKFFGAAGDTSGNTHRLLAAHKNFAFQPTDIRDLDGLFAVFAHYGPFDAVVHCAAQPSHDKAREIPLLDHQVNATGTVNLLEATRQTCPEAVFVFTSTNKVYGDAPNDIKFCEYPTRYDWFHTNPGEWEGYDENTRIDRSTHSVFGANKLAADIMVQEYARTFGMRTVVLRGGCLTGPSHAGVELHGFLSYLVKCAVAGKKYTVYGHKGKQVRDNVHAHDVATAVEAVIADPKPGEVYNLGGGRANSVSVIEAIDIVRRMTGLSLDWEYVDRPRLGDHVCWITDTGKFRRDYPAWSVTKDLYSIFTELTEAG